MTTLGILVLNIKQENDYYNGICKEATKMGIKVCKFAPSSIDPISEMVNGYIYEQEEHVWKKATFVIPPYIYDRCFYTSQQKYKENQPIVQWLKKRSDLTFLGYGLPNKWEIYKVLRQNKALAPYLPYTCDINTPATIVTELERFDDLILKPKMGSRGKGIIGVFSTKKGIEIKAQRHKKPFHLIFSNKDEFISWLEKTIHLNTYLIQPFLSIQDHEIRPYDLRTLLQKNESGKWIIVGKGIRRGSSNQIVSNIYAGAQVESLTNVMKDWTTKERTIFLDDYQTILSNLPKTLENEFGPLFELGIDIGIGKDKRIWILDTNSKPGRKSITSLYPEKEETLFKAPLNYLLHLRQVETVTRSD